jgi:hypothetical protein
MLDDQLVLWHCSEDRRAQVSVRLVSRKRRRQDDVNRGIGVSQLC